MAVQIFNWGDSQGEVLDYVFHGDERYVSHCDDARVGWQSSWSTRGLVKPENRARVLEPVADALGAARPPAHLVVFLSFGSVDVEWNLAYKRDVLAEDPDEARFLGEARAALLGVVRDLAALAARARARHDEARRAGAPPQLHVVLAFPHVPLPLDEMYMHKYVEQCPAAGPGYRIAPRAQRARLWSSFIDGVTGALAAEPALAAVTSGGRDVVDVRADFDARGVAAFCRGGGVEDHHPDYTKTQHVFAARVAALALENDDERAGPLALRPTPTLTALYERARRPLPRPTATAAPWWPVPAAKSNAKPTPRGGGALVDLTSAKLNSPTASRRHHFPGKAKTVTADVAAPLASSATAVC